MRNQLLYKAYQKQWRAKNPLYWKRYFPQYQINHQQITLSKKLYRKIKAESKKSGKTMIKWLEEKVEVNQ